MHMLTPRGLATPAALIATGAAAAIFVAAPGIAVPRAVPAAPPIGGAQLAGKGLILNPGVPKPPKVSASSYVIADADTGQILAAKDPHGYYRPASTLKILTSVTLIPRLNPDKMVKPSWTACNVDGTRVGIVPKMKYKISDLFHGMLMVSGNDAAISLAQQPPGGMATTLKWMNAEAKHLQGYDTVAKTPNGLDKKGQHTSAYDLALFARHGLGNAAFRNYIGTVSYKFPAPRTKAQRKKKKPGGYMIYNHDRLLTQYKGGIGVKNGYTTKAMGTFVGAAKRGGHTILISLMHSNPNFWDAAKHMLSWGFSARTKARPVGRLVDPATTTTKASRAPRSGGNKPAAKPGSSTASGPFDGFDTPVIAVSLAVLILCGAGGYALSRRRRRWFG